MCITCVGKLCNRLLSKTRMVMAVSLISCTLLPYFLNQVNSFVSLLLYGKEEHCSSQAEETLSKTGFCYCWHHCIDGNHFLILCATTTTRFNHACAPLHVCMEILDFCFSCVIICLHCILINFVGSPEGIHVKKLVPCSFIQHKSKPHLKFPFFTNLWHYCCLQGC